MEAAPSVLATFDKDVVKIVSRKMKKQGMKVLTGAMAQGWSEGDGESCLEGKTAKGEEEVAADRIWLLLDVDQTQRYFLLLE